MPTTLSVFSNPFSSGSSSSGASPFSSSGSILPSSAYNLLNANSNDINTDVQWDGTGGRDDFAGNTQWITGGDIQQGLNPFGTTSIFASSVNDSGSGVGNDGTSGGSGTGPVIPTRQNEGGGGVDTSGTTTVDTGIFGPVTVTAPQAPTGTVVIDNPNTGNVQFSGNVGTNPFGTSFGDPTSAIPINTTPGVVGATTVSVPPVGIQPGDYPPGHGSLDPAQNPTIYRSGGLGGSGIDIGVPGTNITLGNIINGSLIGAGVVIGGGLLGGGGSGGSGQPGGMVPDPQDTGPATVPPVAPPPSSGGGSPTTPTDQGPQGMTPTTIPPVLTGSGSTDTQDTSMVVPPSLPNAQDAAQRSGGGSATVPPPVIGTGSSGPTNPPPQTQPTQPTTVPPGGIPPSSRPPTEVTPPTVIPPVVPTNPTTNPPGDMRPPTVIPPIIPTPPVVTTTPTVPTTPSNITFPLRNYYQEGNQSTIDLNALLPGMFGLYQSASGQYGNQDFQNFQNILGQYANPSSSLTSLANQQTIASNRALREANVADVQALAPQLRSAQQAANPELQALLTAYTNNAGSQVAQDAAAVQRGGQLTPEEIRNAQQAAREGWAARGLVNSTGAVAAEVLNREAARQQREATARTNYNQSMGNLMSGIGAQTANKFDPFSTVLGSQYGQQTQNVGTNQNVFGQTAGFSSGQYGNQYVQNSFNPFNNYSQDVYNTNFNAQVAAAISKANNEAALQGAQSSANAQLANNFLNTLFNVGKSSGWWG